MKILLLVLVLFIPVAALAEGVSLVEELTAEIKAVDSEIESLNQKLFLPKNYREKVEALYASYQESRGEVLQMLRRLREHPAEAEALKGELSDTLVVVRAFRKIVERIRKDLLREL